MGQVRDDSHDLDLPGIYNKHGWAWSANLSFQIPFQKKLCSFLHYRKETKMGEKTSMALIAWKYLKLYPFTILLVGILLRCLYKRYATLRKYPGPVLASCTRLWQGRNLEMIVNTPALTFYHSMDCLER